MFGCAVLRILTKPTGLLTTEHGIFARKNFFLPTFAKQGEKIGPNRREISPKRQHLYLTNHHRKFFHIKELHNNNNNDRLRAG